VQTNTIERTAVEAMHNRAKQLVLTQAWLGKPDGLRFAQGVMSSLEGLLHSEMPACFANRDASLGGYQPTAGFEAAWSALPVGAKNFTLAEAQEFLRAQGVELSTDALALLHVNAVGDLKNGVLTPVDLDNEHDAATADVNDSSSLHVSPCVNDGIVVQAAKE
jgi:hypothetical protein